MIALQAKLQNCKLSTSEKGKEPFVAGRLVPQHFEENGQPIFEVSSIDDEVEEAVLQHKFCALKSWRQVLADRFTDHAWTGKPDQRIGLGNIKVPKHSVRCRNPARRWIG